MAGIGEKCEFCGDEIDETAFCDNCTMELHNQCTDFHMDYGPLCPYCYESLID